VILLLGRASTRSGAVLAPPSIAAWMSCRMTTRMRRAGRSRNRWWCVWLVRSDRAGLFVVAIYCLGHPMRERRLTRLLLSLQSILSSRGTPLIDGTTSSEDMLMPFQDQIQESCSSARFYSAFHPTGSTSQGNDTSLHPLFFQCSCSLLF
jgi:hypothetical protein